MTIQPNPAWRGDPTFLKEVLELFGVKTEEFSGWLNRGHGDFNKIQGIIIHHIGSNTYHPSNIARHPTLGLCSQMHVSRKGLATLTGVGIAWHAGKGSFRNWLTNNANTNSIGIEAESDGVTPWPEEELDALYRISAAILWFLGKRATTDTLLGHWEYSNKVQGKWDPGAGNGKFGAFMDMNLFRAKVNHYIDNPPFAAKEKEEEVAFDQINRIYSSRVAGSPFKGKPVDFLLNADAHAFVSRSNTEALLKRQDDLDAKLDKVLEAVANGAR